MAELHDHAIRRAPLSALIIGTIIALALMSFFAILGLSLGIATLSSLGEGLGVGAAIYLVVTQMISLGIGGFAASRLAGEGDLLAAFLQGAGVWALSTLLIGFAAFSGATSALTASANAVSAIARSGANAVEALLPENLSLPDISDIGGNIALSDLPPEIQDALEEQNMTLSQLREILREAFRNVISQQEQQRARTVLTSTAADMIRNPRQFGEELNAAIDRLVEGEDAVISEEDVQEAERVLQQRLELSDEQVAQIVDTVQQKFQTAVETLRQTINDLQTRITEALDTLQSRAAAAAGWLSLASILGFLAATASGAAGRREV